MPLPDDCVKATLVLASPQKDHFYNVFYFKADAGPTYGTDLMADALTLSTAIQTQIIVGVQDMMAATSTIVGINTELHAGGQVYDVSQTLNLSGNVAADELADFEAVVIQKRTAHSGKSGRGRWYLGPIAETLTEENYLTTAGYTAAQVVAGGWLTSVNAIGTTWYPQLWSKKDDSLYMLVSTYVDPKIGQIGGRKSHSIL